MCNAPKLPAAVLSRDYTVPTMEQGAYIVSAFYMAIVSMDTSDEVLCNHCDTWICKKTYLVHLRLYYDGESGKWTKTRKTAGDHDGKHNRYSSSQYNSY